MQHFLKLWIIVYFNALLFHELYHEAYQLGYFRFGYGVDLEVNFFPQFADTGLAAGLRGRGWLLQMNATSVLGYHGAAIELTAWRLLGEGLVDLFGSDGHRTARPATLDNAYRLVETRMGKGARSLFDGSALAGLAAGDGVDLAQGR